MHRRKERGEEEGEESDKDLPWEVGTRGKKETLPGKQEQIR